MSDEKDKSVSLWVESVLEISKIRIATLTLRQAERPRELDLYFFSRRDSEIFWETLPVAPVNAISNRKDKAGRNYELFHRNVTAKQQAGFIQNQLSALKALDAELLGVGKPIIETLNRIEADRALGRHSPKKYSLPRSLMHYIYQERKKFSANPNLGFVWNLSGILRDLLKEKTDIEGMKELSQCLCAKIWQDYEVDIYPGLMLKLVHAYLNVTDILSAQHATIPNMEEARATRPRRLRNIQADAVKTPIGINVVVAEETQRPARGDRREAGGRAGLGHAKPDDLWQPGND